MAKSAKRKAHDAKKAAERQAALEKQQHCNCENTACRHRPVACTVLADNPSQRVMFLGRVCDGCFKTYPREYHLSSIHGRY